MDHVTPATVSVQPPLSPCRKLQLYFILTSEQYQLIVLGIVAPTSYTNNSIKLWQKCAGNVTSQKKIKVGTNTTVWPICSVTSLAITCHM